MRNQATLSSQCCESARSESMKVTEALIRMKLFFEAATAGKKKRGK